MEIHWARFPKFREATRNRVEGRLRRLAEGHGDLIDIHIVAQFAEHHERGAMQVKITCLAGGHPITAEREREDLSQALNESVDVFEREVLKVRDRGRDLRTQHRAERSEEATQATGASMGPGDG